MCFCSNPPLQESSALSLGQVRRSKSCSCPPSCPASPPPTSASGEARRVAAAARVRAGPDLRPCLTLVPTKPCDEARPQERGFNKRYRFLELRLGDFPEDRLCLAGGLCARRGGGGVGKKGQAAPFLLRCPHSCHPLSQSDYLEILRPAGPSAPAAGAVRSVASPGAERWGDPEGPPHSLWDAQAEPDQAGSPGGPETRPQQGQLATKLDTDSPQCHWLQNGHNLPLPVICPPDGGHLVGTQAITVSVWLVRALEIQRGGEKSHRGGGEGDSQKQKVLGCRYLWVAVMTLE